MFSVMAKVKTGRKQKPYVCSWDGKAVAGLYFSEATKRWRIVETGEQFTEHDPRLAVARFRQWQANRDGRHADFFVPVHDPDSANIIRHRSHPTKPGFVTVIEQFPTIHRIDATADDPLTVLKRIPEPFLFNWMKEQILARQKYCAEQTGIEQLGYIFDLKPPTASPTLDEVGNLYFDKAKITDKWRRQSRLFWREFCDSQDAKTLREINQESIVGYKSDVLENAKSPTYAKHRFGCVKTIINYTGEWGKWAEDRVKVLAFCSVLIPPSSTSLDPHPIERAHFHALLNAADPQIQAVLLLALNCCMYGAEVSDIRWTDIDLDKGVLVADRGKTQVARVAVLWKRTIEAMKALPRTDNVLFRTAATKQAHNANTIGKLFRTLRTAANVSTEVKFNWIRDGAYTAAVDSGIEFQHAQILGGHRTGMGDHYLKRKPKIVADACDAVERAYFG
jgi:integrase